VQVPDTLWATDATEGHTRHDGRCATFAIIDHASGDAWVDAAARMDRWAAADLLREVTTERFGSVEQAVAAGLALRYTAGHASAPITTRPRSTTSASPAAQPSTSPRPTAASKSSSRRSRNRCSGSNASRRRRPGTRRPSSGVRPISSGLASRPHPADAAAIRAGARWRNTSAAAPSPHPLRLRPHPLPRERCHAAAAKCSSGAKLVKPLEVGDTHPPSSRPPPVISGNGSGQPRWRVPAGAARAGPADRRLPRGRRVCRSRTCVAAGVAPEETPSDAVLATRERTSCRDGLTLAARPVPPDIAQPAAAR